MKVTVEDNIVSITTSGDAYFVIKVNVDTVDISGMYFNKTTDDSVITVKSVEKNKIKLGLT